MNQALILWMLPLTQLPEATPLDPREVNETGQTLIGLGLAGTMLAGFIFLIALVALSILLIGWNKRRISTNGPRVPDFRHS